MKTTFKKIGNGIYKSKNGYTIKKHTPKNIFTGRPMGSSETRWYIYNSDNERIDWDFTLAGAKAIVETL